MGASVLHGTVGILVLALTVASCGDGESGGMNTGGNGAGAVTTAYLRILVFHRM